MKRLQPERTRSWSLSTVYSCVFTVLVLVQVFTDWPL